ncbi:MAG: hypothetical protein LBB14_03575, partial [Puniceicoccales bacterium]|nr:hypothetical protein [Puniceicoccales bacterium]
NYYRRSTSGEHRHFFYYGWGGDLILRRDPSPAYTFVGLRFAGNSASKTNWNNQNGHHRRLCWIETGVLLPF